MAPRPQHLIRALPLVGALSFVSPVAAQRPAGPDSAGRAAWDVTLARGKTRDIDFTTSEGTWMSADLSPDGSWIVFDVLGHIYRMPASGGDATVLTQNTGVALNFQPRISPDGRTIAFITDRRGQYNLWTMNADGSNPKAVFSDMNATAFEPAWTPDGKFIVIRKGGRGGGGGEGGPPSGGLWMYHKDGGAGVQLVAAGSGGTNGAPSWPSLSGDGKYLYYHVTMQGGEREPLGGSLQIRRFSFKDGEVLDITSGETGSAAASRFSSGGGGAPDVSPDGRWLAFARQIPDGTLLFKGHKFGPRSALWLRDLRTGAERLLMDPIEPMVASGSKTMGLLPRYHWTPDGKSILITQGG
ncbi:MAG: PD40 domain-containing protein [Cytophagaceae bacterium]|nr:PD40 domain-containing protein [Gemmatimonadaceae bacterium]